MSTAGAPRPPILPASLHGGGQLFSSSPSSLALAHVHMHTHATLARSAEPPTMRRINSETNLAVQLLTALRAAPAAHHHHHHHQQQQQHHQHHHHHPHQHHSGPSLAGSEEEDSTDDTVVDLGNVTDSSGSRTTASQQQHPRKPAPAPAVALTPATGTSPRRPGAARSCSGTSLHPSCSPRSAATAPSNERDGARSIPPGTTNLETPPPSSSSLSVLHPAAIISSSSVPTPSADTTLFKYSREERLEAVRRFKEKKRLRTFKKTIRYDVRKRLADTRPRYKGRFSKPPAGESYDDGTPGPPLE